MSAHGEIDGSEGAPRSSLNATPVVALALADAPDEDDNRTTILHGNLVVWSLG